MMLILITIGGKVEYYSLPFSKTVVNPHSVNTKVDEYTVNSKGTKVHQKPNK